MSGLRFPKTGRLGILFPSDQRDEVLVSADTSCEKRNDVTGCPCRETTASSRENILLICADSKPFPAWLWRGAEGRERGQTRHDRVIILSPPSAQPVVLRWCTPLQSREWDTGGSQATLHEAVCSGCPTLLHHTT